jgi:hypothetical protein
MYVSIHKNKFLCYRVNYRTAYGMMLLPTLIIILIFLVIVKFILPILIRYSQLKKDYQNISPLPLSSIPFVGNVHQFDKRTYVFYELITRLAKECQDQNKGVFCLWYTIKPMIILCSGKGLEVCAYSISSRNTISLFDLDIY